MTDDPTNLLPLRVGLRRPNADRNSSDVVNVLAARHRFIRAQTVHEVQHDRDYGAGAPVASPAVKVHHLAACDAACQFGGEFEHLYQAIIDRHKGGGRGRRKVLNKNPAQPNSTYDRQTNRQTSFHKKGKVTE